MQKIGVPPKDVTISGIPISKAYSFPIVSEEVRKTFNLPPQDRVVVVLCSALTLKKSIQILEDLAGVQLPVRYLVLAGTDSTKEAGLQKRFAKDPRFTIFGFSKEIATMMKAADIIITKPGGLIVSEALAIGLPQILLEPIPGQEEANARHAVGHAAAISVTHRPHIYKEILTRLLSDPDTLKRMSEAAMKVGKPHAATHIVETIIG